MVVCMVRLNTAFNKYRSKKTEIDGIVFASKKEANRYCELKLLLKANEIADLELQPKFLLQEAFKNHGTRYKEINYIADFQYYDSDLNKIVIEEVKGFATRDYKIKKKLFLHKYPGYIFKEIH